MREWRGIRFVNCGARLPIPAEVDRFEVEHDVVLPVDYREFLLVVNGGVPAEPMCVYGGGGSEFQLEHLFPLAVGSSNSGLAYARSTSRRVLGRDLMPIGYDETGNEFVMRIRGAAGAVLFVPHRLSDAVEVAPSFTAFVERLEARRNDD